MKSAAPDVGEAGGKREVSPAVAGGCLVVFCFFFVDLVSLGLQIPNLRRYVVGVFLGLKVPS